MNTSKMISLLNDDLGNEYKHLHFYLHSGLVIQGLYREEYRGFLLKEAAGEMLHVQQFGDIILGLGGFPVSHPKEFPANLTNPKDILTYAFEMEKEVVHNYVQRMQDAKDLGGDDGQWLEIFLEDQIMKSRQDVDHYRQIIAGLR